jgi:hypothetical protein
MAEKSVVWQLFNSKVGYDQCKADFNTKKKLDVGRDPFTGEDNLGADEKKKCGAKIASHADLSSKAKWNHLQHFHEEDWKRLKEDDAKKKKGETGGPKQAKLVLQQVSAEKKLTAVEREQLQRALAVWVAAECLPLSIAESKGFKNLMRLASEDKWEGAVHQTVKEHIMKLNATGLWPLVGSLTPGRSSCCVAGSRSVESG